MKISTLTLVLKIARERKGFTQARLAEQLGVSLSTVRSMEYSAGNIKFATVLRACKLLGVDIGNPAIILNS